MNRSLGSHPVFSWCFELIAAWNQFWFAPSYPHTLALLRIGTGIMLLYSHTVLATDLLSFVGDDAWVNNTAAQSLRGPNDWGWTYLWMLHSPILLWAHHLITLLLTFAFAIGFLTRITAPLAWFLQLMLVQRLTGALFGFDQVTTMLAMYLALSPCGAVYSVDALIRQRRNRPKSGGRRNWIGWFFPDDLPSTSATVVTRLVQLHLCVIYLFGGIWKARGEMWWDGTALWYALSNLEYQSVDITWLASRFPRLCSAASHLTVFWEIYYCALIWPRLTRPLVLLIAVMVHGGIAVFLGMITFGITMILANGIFLSPAWVRQRIRFEKPNKDPAKVGQQTRPTGL